MGLLVRVCLSFILCFAFAPLRRRKITHTKDFAYDFFFLLRFVHLDLMIKTELSSAIKVNLCGEAINFN